MAAGSSSQRVSSSSTLSSFLQHSQTLTAENLAEGLEDFLDLAGVVREGQSPGTSLQNSDDEGFDDWVILGDSSRPAGPPPAVQRALELRPPSNPIPSDAMLGDFTICWESNVALDQL